MKIFITKKIPQKGIDLLKSAGNDISIHDSSTPLSETELIKASQQADYVLNGGMQKFDANFFQNCPNLKALSLMSVGYDNVDISAATQHGIPVSNTPGILSGATADVAFLLMLSVSRKAFFNHKRILQGEWKGFDPTANLGIELNNKTLGIYGLGRIGFEFARKAKAAYNMEIIYYNRSRNEEAEQILGARYVNFDDLLTRSDVLSIHAALTAETKNRFDKNTFTRMKNSAVLVNTARGGLVNELDLIEALQTGQLWGAGLDVTDPEPMDPKNPLLTMENVCILPHIGSATVETRDNMALMAASNLLAAIKGEKMPQIINKEVYQ
ncbi:2-hydroxyacid dehydrogenase [Sphingobacterium siyangense]|uniref:2-hydroxyacid dehydrogenase n=1 Tax=Sphingobacterium TaxID=28453 RepID=UPI000DFDA7D5|nr:D-glycerate dehydrogenase [Sphingobacterium multivorum]QQT46610.1 D-glycerate dehydrogenase [Sphingobacterium multivorum]SUJ89435.1 Glyoxylate/hydroxypyruvate reductase B [Sphingobacterium multivorum]